MPVLGVFCRGCGMSKGALGEFCIACGIDAWLSDGKQCDKSLDWRPCGGRRSGGAVGSVDYRNDKFADVGLSAARTASCRAGLAAAGNLVGYGQHRK